MISVVIPTHARGKIVRHAVASVLRAKSAIGELIVVEDRTCEAEAALSDHISTGEVTFFRKTTGAPGAAATRNFGVHHARGDYVLFLDDDDRFAPDYIGRLAAILNQPDRAWGFCNQSINGAAALPKHETSAKLSDVTFKQKIAAISAGFWIKKDLFEKVGHFDEAQKIDEDTDLCCRLLADGIDPFYLDMAGVHLNRDGGLSRLTAQNDLLTTITYYRRTLEKNFASFDGNKEARWFLVDRVHRMICKAGRFEDLAELRPYRVSHTLRLIQALRERRYRRKHKAA